MNREDKENKEKRETVEEQDKYVFMREEIKRRPINKHKLARNTLLAAVSAVVFGLVACLTFALLSPFVLSRINKGNTPATSAPRVSIPEDTIEDEMAPEDMLITHEEPEIDLSKYEFLEEEEVRALLEEVKFSLNDYQDLYKSLSSIGAAALKSVVRVTPVKQSTDWFNNITQSSSELSGLIVADNGSNLYVLTNYSKLTGADSIIVTFANGIKAEAELVKSDESTGLCALAISADKINELTRNSIEVASFGSSTQNSLVGSPVIAVGSPSGIYGSMNYGIVTSNSQRISVVDYYYKHLTTDMYGSQSATGILINLRGEVVGMIDTKFNSNDARNLICAIGITELKRTIATLSNGEEIPYFGINGGDVPVEAVSMYGAPEGVFVKSLEMDSPALAAGIQSGDIIVRFNDAILYRFSDYVNALRNTQVGHTVTVVVYRSTQDTYREMTFEVVIEGK